MKFLKLLIPTMCLAIGAAPFKANEQVRFDRLKLETAHPANFDEYTYSGSYYSGITSNATGLSGQLRKQLTALIYPKAFPTYGGDGSGERLLSNVLQEADEDPTNNKNMVLLYTRDSITKRQSNGAANWNREHVWPQNNSNGNWGKSEAGCDMLHIRPTYETPNGQRGNKKYADVTSGSSLSYNNITYGKSDSNYFEPLDSVKGDVARICMYVYVCYCDHYSNMPDITKVFKDYNTLLTWHINDRPDAMEGNRNDYVEGSFQKNRNPFVDHPEYAWKIFGNNCSASVLSQAQEAYPDGDVDISEYRNEKIAAFNNYVNGLDMSKYDENGISSIESIRNSTITNMSNATTISDINTAYNNGVSAINEVPKQEPVTIHVTSVSLNTSAITLNVGQTYQLAATVLPENAEDKSVSYSSNNANASVSQSGLITANKAGTSTITVTTTDGNKKATCTVTVEKQIPVPTSQDSEKEYETGTNNYPLFNLDTNGETIVSVTVDGANVENSSYIYIQETKEFGLLGGFVKTLAEGNHTIVVTTRGGSVSWTLNVVAGAPEPQPITPSKSGCGGSILATSSILFIVTISGLALLKIKKNKN